APAVSDLLGGQVDVLFASAPTAIEHIAAGKLVGLAVTGAQRLDALPDLPPVGELVPGYDMSAWYGLGTPRGPADGASDKITIAANRGLADAKLKARFADLGGVTLGGSPADFAKLIAEETDKWAKVIRAANIKPQ